MKPISLPTIARLGQFLQAFTVPPKTASAADIAITEFIELLDSCDLPQTRGTAQQLVTFQTEKARKHSSGSGMPRAMDLELATISRTLMDSLQTETADKHAILLDRSAVATGLINLSDRLQYLTESQHRLCEEVMRCLECSAYRSSIVMMWNFAYDYVRHWVFSNHLVTFNQELTTKFTTKKAGHPHPRYTAITEYSDFWDARPAPGERTVLDTCQSANILTGKAYDSLIEFLRRRNDYAHPNFKTPDVDLTKGYIAELIGVITAPPFPTA